MSTIYRPFNDPQRFEREKATRIMPQDLDKLGEYILRMMLKPSDKLFAIELPSQIIDVEQKDDTYRVQYLLMDHDGTTMNKRSSFSLGGLMIGKNKGRYPNLPEIVEIGYFVGSTDDYDIALAEEVARREPVGSLV